MKDFSPFKSQHGHELNEAQRSRWGELVDSAFDSASEENLDEALRRLSQAERIDGARADLHFRRGRLLLASGQPALARESFRRAIDLDVCPLRATSEIQHMTEATAIAARVPLVDFDSILMNDAVESFGHSSPGNEYFLDHVHPSIASHRLLALAIIEAMRLAGLVDADRQWDDAAIADVTRRIEARLNPEMQSRGLTNLAQVLSWAGKQAEAGPIALEAVRLRSEQSLQAEPESLFYAAVHFAMIGQDARATELLRDVVRMQPKDSRPRWRLATLLYDQQRFDEAETHFAEAVRLDPTDAHSHRMLGVLRLKAGDREAAMESFRKASDAAPDDDGIRRSITTLLAGAGQRDDDSLDRDGRETEGPPTRQPPETN